MKLLYLILLAPLFGLSQSTPNLSIGITFGANMGFVESHGDYSLDYEWKAFPAMHLGASLGLDYPDYLFETGVSIEGAVFKEEQVYISNDGSYLGSSDLYDISSYIAIPLVVYPKKWPLGIHGGLKPKFEIGSTTIVEDGEQGAKPGYEDLNYLAPFGLDAVVGLSLPVSFMTFSMRYERGLLNRLGNSPDYKEYDNQFKLILNFRIYQTGN